MDLAAVSVLLLLGGYCFASVWRRTVLTTRKLDGHHLYFRAALCGAILFLSALAARTTLLAHWPTYQRFDLALIEYIEPILRNEPGVTLYEQTRRLEWVVVSIYSLVLGTVCGPTLNRVTPRRWIWRRTLSPLYGFLAEAQRSNQPVTLTIGNGAVYVGRVIAFLELARDPAAITLLIAFSGQRNSQGRLELTTDYEVIYRTWGYDSATKLNAPANLFAPFELTLRTEDIVAVAPFSPNVYERLNPGWRQQIARQAQAAARGKRLTSDDPLDPPVYVLS